MLPISDTSNFYPQADTSDNRGTLNHQKKSAEKEALITEIGDTVHLSPEALENFFESEAKRLNSSVHEITATKKTITLNNEVDQTSFTKIRGTKNTIIDSNGQDILYLKGNANNLLQNFGQDSFLIDGSSNQLEIKGNSAEIALIGDRNKVSAEAQTISHIALRGDNNILNTADSNDFFFANGNRNKIFSAAGDDTIVLDGNHNIIESGAGDDFLITSGKAQSINTGQGNDSASLQGSGTIYTKSGNDIIEIKGTQFSAYAGSGNDIVILETSGHQVFTEEGNDLIAVKAKSGYLKIDGGIGEDTLSVDFNRAEVSTIANGNILKFFFSEEDFLEIDINNMEKIKFKDNEIFTIDEIKKIKGNESLINFEANKSVIRNTKKSTNVARLDISSKNIISGSKTVNGIKINFINDQGHQKSLQLIGFDYLKLENGNYLSIDTNGDFLHLDVNPNETILLTEDIANNKTKLSIFDKQTEDILQTIFVNNNSSVLFKDESIYTINELKNLFFGNTTEIDITSKSSFEPEDLLTNVAKVNLDATAIQRLEKIGLNHYKLIYKNEALNSSIDLKNVSFLETQEGSKINLNEYNQNVSTIRKNEKSHDLYKNAHRNTEFKRIAYNLTGNIQFIESLIDGGYKLLSDQEKNQVIQNADTLKNSINFTTDRFNSNVDEASKTLFTIRLANLLRNNTSTMQALAENGFELNMATTRDLGGDSAGFVTGYAEYSGNYEEPQFKIALTYSTFYGGLYDGNDGDNVDIHEAMHLVDYLNDEKSGLPFGISPSTASQLEAARSNLFTTYQKTKDDVGIIRTYGFSDQNEFLAVSTEAYYETPNALAETSQPLYEALSNYFKSI